MGIKKAAVVGAGTMGAGIAQVLSQAGIEVILKDVNSSYVERGLASVKRMYDSRVKKAVLDQQEASRLLGLIRGDTTYDGFRDVDLVIEAAPEQLEIKSDIFAQLDKHCPARTIFASNTSALSISELAAHTTRPGKTLGMHFFNPAQFMKLVEIIPGVKTSADTTTQILELTQALGKIPVAVEECPGFLVNRILFPYMHEALYMLQEGIAQADEIDAVAVAFGLPMGPLALFDMTGIDVCYSISEFLYQSYGPRFEPPELLSALVDKGYFGQKSGRGFFVHPQGAPPQASAVKELNPELPTLLEAVSTKNHAGNRPAHFTVERLLLPMLNEAIYALQERVVAAADIDIAVQHGLGLKRGLLTLAQEKGLSWCLKAMRAYQEIYGERFRPAWLLAKLAGAGVHDLTNPDNSRTSTR